jgi:hypothetical protein
MARSCRVVFEQPASASTDSRTCKAAGYNRSSRGPPLPFDAFAVQVMELLAQGVGTYSDSRELGLAIDMLIQGNPTSHPGPDSFVLGQGIWQVSHQLAEALDPPRACCWCS